METIEATRQAAFEAYIRKGAAMPAEAVPTGSEGGYLVPIETEAKIDAALAAVSPMRGIATVRAGVAAEFPAMELYAMPAATQSLLDDALVDVEAWVADECQYAFAAQESAAFINGDGTNKPRGFLNYPKIPNGEWEWGKIGVIDGALTADTLLVLAYAPKPIYRQNARFVMNRATEAQVRMIKDGAGNYVWNPGASSGAPATLLGFPVVEAEDMPDLRPGQCAIAFGDFLRGYLIEDRQGVRILRDPYSAKPYVLFYTTKRVGGGVQNFEAIKLFRLAPTAPGAPL